MIDAEAQLRGSVAAPQSMNTLSKPVAEEFLRQLAQVSEALAADDQVAAIQAGQKLQELAASIDKTGEPQIDGLIAQLKQIPKISAATDLKALRQAFLPWSTAGADLALAIKRGGQASDVTVFECPMTGDSFPGAPCQGEVGSIRLRHS